MKRFKVWYCKTNLQSFFRTFCCMNRSLTKEGEYFWPFCFPKKNPKIRDIVLNLVFYMSLVLRSLQSHLKIIEQITFPKYMLYSLSVLAHLFIWPVIPTWISRLIILWYLGHFFIVVTKSTHFTCIFLNRKAFVAKILLIVLYGNNYDLKFLLLYYGNFWKTFHSKLLIWKKFALPCLTYYQRKNRVQKFPIQSPLTTHKWEWRTYANPDIPNLIEIDQLFHFKRFFPIYTCINSFLSCGPSRT
jgi:hypothetical protein